MLALQKLHTARIKKNPTDPDSDNDSDDDMVAKEAQELGTAFDKAIDQLSDGSLYGAQMVEIINRLLEDYSESCIQRIQTGTTNEKWTLAKIKHANQLALIAEDAMKEESGLDSGRRIQSNLIRGMEVYKSEFLPAKREEFNYENKLMPPEVGSLEKKIIPAIERSIDIVFRVYRLYQIEDRTDGDFRISGEGSEEAVKLVQTAHKMAKRATDTLLRDFSKERLDLAAKSLSEIQREYNSLLRTSTASKGRRNTEEDLPGVDRAQLFNVFELFTRKFHDIKQAELASASRTVRVYAKRAVVGTVSTVAATAGMIGNAGNYLTEKALDLMIGNTEGPQGKSDDSDFDGDELPVMQSPLPQDLSLSLQELYKEEPTGASSSSSTATSSTLLNLSPTSQNKKSTSPKPPVQTEDKKAAIGNKQ